MATALMEVYADYATAHAAIEAIDDTKVIAVFPYQGRIVVVKKT